MDWISKLEKKYNKYSVSGIMKYLIMFQIVGYMIIVTKPEFYYTYLSLDAKAILQGQLWRIITFLITPTSTSLFYALIAFYLYFMIGETLERIWGAFRFNIYLYMGILFHVVGALLTYLIFGFSTSIGFGTSYLYLSLFLAFAASFPDTQFLLFFVIPIKAKYLGWVNGAFFAYTVLQGILPSYVNSVNGIFYQANALAAFVSLLNFMVFFFTTRTFGRKTYKQKQRTKQFKQQMNKTQRPTHTYTDGAKHKCTVCGRTELDDPNLEFRYCSKCKGNHEYCQDHLFTHEHVK